MDNNPQDESYIKFWAKFYQKAQEIRNEYDDLSDENKKRASLTAQEILITKGIVGIMEYGKKISERSNGTHLI